jgi:hypothetical protein
MHWLQKELPTRFNHCLCQNNRNTEDSQVLRRSPFSPLLVIMALGLSASACRGGPAATPAATPTPAITFSGPVTLESAQSLTAVVDDNDPWFAALSPNGAHIAYYKDVGRGQDRKGQICVFTLASSAKACHDLSRDVFVGFPYQLQWSPDSSMIAFSENPAELGYESDIWLFKVADGSFTNLTDDGVTESWRSAMVAQPDKPIVLDFLPAWNTADGNLYFWRGTPLGNMQFTLALYRVSPAGGEPALVREVTSAIPRSLPLFKQEGLYLDGPSAISPDGRNLAALMSSLDEFGGLQSSLWIIDLGDVSVAPRQVITSGQFSAALPAWQYFPAYPTGLTWTADGRGVVTIAQSEDAHTPFTLFYQTDVASGETTPVVDFSGLPDSEAYFALAPGSELPMRYFSPWTGSLSPKGDKLLMLSDLAGVMGLLTSLLPPSGALPFVSAAAKASTMSIATRSSRSSDGKVLLYGLLLKIKE